MSISVWEVRELYFINSYSSYEYHAPLPLFSAILPLAAAALVSLIVGSPSALEVPEPEAIAVPDVTSPDLPPAAISSAFLFPARICAKH